MSSTEPARGPQDEDGYDGPAELIDGDVAVAVNVTLRGNFDPIRGKYSWYGRVAASDEVAALLAGGTRKVTLRTPHAQVETSLSDVDPWGRPRVEGVGQTPFPVLDTPPGDTLPGDTLRLDTLPDEAARR